MTRLQRSWTRINPLWLFAVWFLCLWFIAGCAGNHCRADQRMPEGATFDELEKMTREQCK